MKQTPLICLFWGHSATIEGELRTPFGLQNTFRSVYSDLLNFVQFFAHITYIIVSSQNDGARILNFGFRRFVQGFFVSGAHSGAWATN